MIVRLDVSRKRRSGSAICILRAAGAVSELTMELGAHMPFRSSTIDEIRLGRALTYVEDFVATMTEIARISKAGAIIYARMPHASSTWGVTRDPELKQACTLETFRYFSPDRRDGCPGPTFEVERAHLHLKGSRSPDANDSAPASAVTSALESLANSSRGMQYRWERWFGPLIGGFEEFSVVLSAVKGSPIP